MHWDWFKKIKKLKKCDTEHTSQPGYYNHLKNRAVWILYPNLAIDNMPALALNIL